MKLSFWIIIYSYVIFANGTFGKIQKIVGGVNVNIKNVPYMVSIRFSGSNHFCGGSIISVYHILTAAHCIWDKQHLIEHITIHSASSSSSLNHKRKLEISRFDVPKEYTGQPQSVGDIAVLTLRTPITYNRLQLKIKLPTKDVAVGEEGIITGWGSTTYPADGSSERLRKASMKIVEESKCIEMLEGLEYEGRFCAFQSPGIGICVGDSGSPLVIDEKIIGISSFVIPCATGEPDVYTNVYTYVGFINRIIGNTP